MRSPRGTTTTTPSDARCRTTCSGLPSHPQYELARRHFGEKELVDLTLAIVAINGWNRLAIAFRTVPGSYKPELSH